MEAEDTKDLIEEAIERAEAAQSSRDEAGQMRERRFRDRVSILVGLFAATLAVVHVVGGASGRDATYATIEASDTYAYMQAKVVRETVLRSSAKSNSVSDADRSAMEKEARRLRNADAAGHGIDQLRKAADKLRDQAELQRKLAERFEFAETGMQISIVLLSIALVARSARIVLGSAALAAISIVIAAWAWFAQ